MSQTIQFKSAVDVARFVQQAYRSLGKGLTIHPAFKNEVGQHARLIDPHNQKKYHIKFARERFHKFSQLNPGYGTGEGESIKKEILDELADDDLVFFGTGNEILKIFVGDIREFGVLRVNREFKDSTYSVAVEKCEQFL